MKTSKIIFRLESLGDQQRRVSSKKFARLREAAPAKAGNAAGSLFQQTHSRNNMLDRTDYRSLVE